MNGPAIRWSATRTLGTAAAAVAAAALLAGCFSSTDIVDTKQELNLPDGKGTCYMMEIDGKDGAGKDVGESFYCAPKDEYDKNRVGEEWVDANGKKK